MNGNRHARAITRAYIFELIIKRCTRGLTPAARGRGESAHRRTRALDEDVNDFVYISVHDGIGAAQLALDLRRNALVDIQAVDAEIRRSADIRQITSPRTRLPTI